MENYDDILSDNSGNEEAYYSDRVDSDIEAELYGLIHHDTQDNSISIQDQSYSVQIGSSSQQDKSILGPTDDNCILPLTNSVASENIVNSTKNQKNSAKKNNKNFSTPVTTNQTSLFSSDAIVNNNLCYSFDSPDGKQRIQRNQIQSENSKRNIKLTPAKRKSDVVSEILLNIQLKKNTKSMKPEKSIPKQKKDNPHHSSMTNLESFVEVLEDSSDSDSDGSIIFLEPDQSNLQTNIANETVVLSSDSEGSDSSMEESFSKACQKKQTEMSNADIGPNNKDVWHINSEDKFRTKKQSNRYHDNAVVTCSKCQLKGHSAKFCSVPKAMKCFFCGDYHSGMNCKNKICTKCFQQGHDRRRCHIRYIDTCELCRMRGHSEKNCPDLWRRYHLTTSKGSIVKGNPNPHSPLYCYNCGSKGHYGAECMETHIDRWSFPTWTSVISYKNPIPVPQRQNERNFQYKERNFHQRSNFDRTPLFHRRKGNETFSKNTPPTQNTTKKKNKKSPKTPPSTNHQSTTKAKGKKSPKMPPSTNHQSTTGENGIVQNEVYFPRTPTNTRSARARRRKAGREKAYQRFLNREFAAMKRASN